MRVSIWQEFSSNHSARFTVVGLFDSSDAAGRAAEELTTGLKQIEEWFHRPENAEALEKREQALPQPPTPPEIQLARQYGVEWGNYSLDWLWFDNEGRGPVTRAGKLIFVDGTESELGAKPVSDLIEKLGARALVDGHLKPINEEDDAEIGRHLYVDLECDAPNDEVAQRITDEIASYLLSVQRDSARMFDVPWKAFASHPMAVSNFNGTISREQGRLTIQRGEFFHIAVGLPSLLGYLKSMGCTHIRYRFDEDSY